MSLWACCGLWARGLPPLIWSDPSHEVKLPSTSCSQPALALLSEGPLDSVTPGKEQAAIPGLPTRSHPHEERLAGGDGGGWHGQGGGR